MTKQLAFLGVILLAIFPACSVKYSLSGASIPANIRTVSVSYFQNRAPIVQPSLSDALTEALKKKITTETNLIMVQSDGDIQFEGEIVDYSQIGVAPQANSTAGMNRLTIGVKFRFINSKEPEKNVEDKISKYQDIPSETNISSVEGSIVTDLSKLIANDIFLKALADW